MPDEKKGAICSFCGKSQDEVAKIIAGPGAAYICDECIDLCNDIIMHNVEPADDDADTLPVGVPTGMFIVREAVARYANSNIRDEYSDNKFSVDWECRGCGWRLRLKPGTKPPTEHSEQIPLGLLGEDLRELPQLEMVPRCPNPEWKRFP